MTVLEQAVESELRIVDYDLHGIVGVRLVGAAPGDVAAVDAQLGPIQGALRREPDIVVHFVERLDLRGPLRYVGLDDAAFADDAFVVFTGRSRARRAAKLSFEEIGGRCELVCESGAPAVPLLLAIINISALARGVVPLHASAFSYRGTDVLVTGWAKGGKTEALLSFMEQGAQYIGDEWIYIRPDDGHMFGIPEPIRIWDWHLDDLPHYRERLPGGARRRLR